ncbi:MAG TPA: hypothetical protein PKX15_10010 [Bacteroidales bacterium]|jgi:hypothetical protein|nr:hypothetical protein [Bacteroidales bacterium]
MKQYFFIFIALFLFSCNYQKAKQVDKTIIDIDTLFEKKIPVLIFNKKVLQKEFDSIVEKELNCFYYKKDTTCFGIWSRVLGNDTLLIVSSANYNYIDFSDTGFDEGKRTDGVYGYFRYKDFGFFCSASCIKHTDLFYETRDSIKVKNSPLLYVEYESGINDTYTQWSYIYKNKKLIEYGKTTCKQY